MRLIEEKIIIKNNVKFRCRMFLQETFVIEDCKYYDAMTSNSGKWTIQSGLTPSYSTNGCNISGLSAWKSMGITQSFTAPVSMEFNLVATSGSTQGACPIVEFKGTSHQSGNDMVLAYGIDKKLYIYDKNSSSQLASSSFGYGVYRVDFESSSNVKVYYENTQIYSSTNWNISNPYFTVGTGANRSFTFKNVKIKPL